MNKIELFKQLQEEENKIKGDYEKAKVNDLLEFNNKLKELGKNNLENWEIAKSLNKCLTIELGVCRDRQCDNGRYMLYFVFNPMKFRENEKRKDKSIFFINSEPMDCANENCRFKDGEYYNKENTYYTPYCEDFGYCCTTDFSEEISEHRRNFWLDFDEMKYSDCKIAHKNVFDFDYIQERINKFIDDILEEYQKKIEEQRALIKKEGQ